MIVGRKVISPTTVIAVGLCAGGIGSAAAQTSTIVIAPTAPSPPRVETIPPPPTAADAWVQGHWAWTGTAWAWVPGRYVAPPVPRASWVPGHWDTHAGGYIWVDGHWAG